MPDIKELLGGSETPAQNPLEATPDGEVEEGNPLEKMDEVAKATPNKKDAKSASLDADTVEEMLKTGENTSGMFTPDEEKPKDGEPKLHEDVDDDAKVKVGKTANPQGKYKDMFKKDLLKNPNDYKVQTPRGEMTIAEAIKQGYNPITKRFDKSHGTDKIKERELSKLNDADRASVEGLLSPERAQVAPADAEKYGLKPGSPMIRPDQAPDAAAMGGGMPMPPGGAMPPAAGPAPDMGGGIGAALGEGAPVPQGPQGGGMDLAAMLGGGM